MSFPIARAMASVRGVLKTTYSVVSNLLSVQIRLVRGADGLCVMRAVHPNSQHDAMVFDRRAVYSKSMPCLLCDVAIPFMMHAPCAEVYVLYRPRRRADCTRGGAPVRVAVLT